MLEEKLLKISIPPKEAEISPEGLREIYYKVIIYFSDLAINFDEVINEITPYWVVSKGEFAGTFPKRLFKIAKIKYGIKLNNNVLGEIGNIAQKYTLNREYFIEFSRNFNWNPGEFGDGGSCFFGMYRYQRTRIKLLGGYAMKIYDPDKLPIGRAWVLPYDNTKENFVVFNSYTTKNYNLVFFARLLSFYLGGIYEKVEEEIPGIYTNNGYFYFVSARGEEYNWINLERYFLNTSVSCLSCGESFPVLDLKKYTDDIHLYCPQCDIILAP